MPLYKPNALQVVTKTATYSVAASDDVILCNTNAFTVTLPAASAQPGRKIQIKKIGNDANAITIARAGSDTIEGATSFSLASAAQYSDVTLVSDGTSIWYISNHAQWL